MKKQNVIDRMICCIISNIDHFLLSKLFINKKPSLNDTVRQELYKRYKVDIENLEVLLNVELSHWKTVT